MSWLTESQRHLTSGKGRIHKWFSADGPVWSALPTKDHQPSFATNWKDWQPMQVRRPCVYPIAASSLFNIVFQTCLLAFSQIILDPICLFVPILGVSPAKGSQTPFTYVGDPHPMVTYGTPPKKKQRPKRSGNENRNENRKGGREEVCSSSHRGYPYGSWEREWLDLILIGLM